MKEGRIRELREGRRLLQSVVASEIGITQQSLSKYERNITYIKPEILEKLSIYFNVTTDYILGLSDIKRDLQRQMQMSKEFDECYELVELYNSLDQYDKKFVWSLMNEIKNLNIQRVKNGSE